VFWEQFLTNKHMKIKLLSLLTLAFALYSCGPNLEDAMRQQMQTLDGMSELGTVEYTITKIVKANDNAIYKVGERKILFSCTATMKAGIDLAEFNADDVVINNSEKSITVTLPKPKVLAFNMPAEKAKLEYEKVSGMRFEFTPEERNNLLKQGEESILADAENLGVLKDAEENAKVFFEALLIRAGFESVNLKFE
jgi:hypothetical protein